MNFQDIPARILSIRVKPTTKIPALQEQPVFSVEARLSRTDEFEIRLIDSVVFVRPVVAGDIRLLNAELASGRSLLAQLASPATDGSIELQIAFFTGDSLEMGDVEIGVDEYVESGLVKMRLGEKGKRPYEALGQICCFQQGDNAYFFLTTGPAIDEQLKPDADEAPREVRAEPTSKNSFGITGDGIRFVATEKIMPGGNSIFIATRLTKRRNDPDRALRLARGWLRFVDWTQAGQVQILAKAQMTALTQDDGSYLKKWDEFGDMEGELLLKQARAVGALQFTDMTQRRDGSVSVRIVEASDSAVTALAEGRVLELELVNELPGYLLDETLSFKEFEREIRNSAEVAKKLGEKREKNETKTYFEVIRFDKEGRSVTLRTENLPTPSGTLVLSLKGDVAQIERRMNARQAILEGRSANPQLGLLIEEQGQIARTRKPQKVLPLTAFVRKKVFRNAPTVMQEKAIEVALNTPDIALIQGPPGTGKTTVIAAILERLNEMADKRGARVKGQILLTGFQHDAVENMIERLSLNSIPVPKFGKRSGAPEDDYSAFERNLEDWCSKLATELRERNPQIAEVEQEREIKNLFLQYVQAPTRPLAGSLIRKIAALGVAMLGESGTRRAEILSKNLAREEKLNEDSSQWLNAARRLRVRPESFSDDGPERSADALDDLHDVLEESERELLDRASLWRSEDGPPSFLSDLEALKRRLLVRFSSPPVFRVEKQNYEVIALAELAIQRIKTVGHSAKDKKSAALAEFLAELESNPYGMMDAVSDYSFAFAATCQQSVNKKMQMQKGITGRGVNESQIPLEYEYVIVDEAARVSPRDLMVAMAQGKRIILVGDHRQLPHIIDEEVARQMEEGEASRDEDSWLKQSMFQYLFATRLKALEEGDGITRRVTLDKQYRMHPLLGAFISRNFYERFDPAEQFGSGQSADDFAHTLSSTNGKPAVWLDVPAQRGRHQPDGTSRTRPAETTVIVRQLQAWMSSDAGKGLSFGVISFYKAQADRIREQLKREFGGAADDEKKIRVGTVDSFQGMEFDVVFLSIVRVMPNPAEIDKAKKRVIEKGEYWNNKREAQFCFGHLCLYNRLNVSMSRQKKLLVVVGDAGSLQNQLAADSVPGLVDFLQLCRSEGVVLPC
ncbi:MAG: AAA domain-containing protein [Nitrosomonas ureae]